MTELVPAVNDLYTPPVVDDSWRRAAESPTTVERELQVIRWLADQAVQSGKSASAVHAFVDLAAKLVKQRREEREEDDQRLDREEVVKMATELYEAVGSVLKENDIENVEAILASISTRISATLHDDNR